MCNVVVGSLKKLWVILDPFSQDSLSCWKYVRKTTFVSDGVIKLCAGVTNLAASKLISVSCGVPATIGAVCKFQLADENGSVPTVR